jgi:hypothetical protein
LSIPPRLINRHSLSLPTFLLTIAAGCAAAKAAEPPPDPALERQLATEVAQYVAADRVAAPAHCQVLFVGSSSIVMWREALARDMAPLPVIDRGFGGSHIEYVNRWFDELVLPYKPRAIVLYAGENDLDAGKSVARVVSDFDEFMARKTRELGATPVYFISLKPTKARFAQLALQDEVNVAIRARAKRRADLHYIDVATPMLKDGKPRDLFGPDGLHMNEAGYRLWTQVVRDALLPDAETQLRSCRKASELRN